jgi:hypothetical protein
VRGIPLSYWFQLALASTYRPSYRLRSCLVAYTSTTVTYSTLCLRSGYAPSVSTALLSSSSSTCNTAAHSGTFSCSRTLPASSQLSSCRRTLPSSWPRLLLLLNLTMSTLLSPSLPPTPRPQASSTRWPLLTSHPQRLRLSTSRNPGRSTLPYLTLLTYLSQLALLQLYNSTLLATCWLYWPCIGSTQRLFVATLHRRVLLWPHLALLTWLRDLDLRLDNFSYSFGGRTGFHGRWSLSHFSYFTVATHTFPILVALVELAGRCAGDTPLLLVPAHLGIHISSLISSP